MTASDKASTCGSQHSPTKELWLAVFRPRVQERYVRRNWAMFCILGFINNFHYCVVLSGAVSLVESFHYKSYSALVSWALIFGGVIVRLLNAFVFEHWSYNLRYLIAGLQTLAGVIIVAISPFLGDNDAFKFAMALIGIVILGNGSSWGESVSLGYMEQFPSRSIGAWSSGTGWSGVVGSLLYLALSSIPGMTNTYIFLLTIPFVFAYLGTYYFGVKHVPMNPPSDFPMLGEASITNDQALQPSMDDDGVRTRGESAEREVLVNQGASHGQQRDADDIYGQGERIRGSPELTDEEQREFNLKADAFVESYVPAATIWGRWRSLRKKKSEDDGAVAQGVLRHKPNDDENEAEEDVPCACGCCRSFAQKHFPRWNYDALCRCHAAILFQCVNLLLVYVFEYGVQFMAPYAFPEAHSRNATVPVPYNGTNASLVNTTVLTSQEQHVSYGYFTTHSFVITQFCYQVGVLFSRSSLAVTRVRRVELLSFFQFINFVCWVVQGKTLLLSDKNDPDAQEKYTFILFGWMIIVGLFGGASYVNVFYNILQDEDGKLAGIKERYGDAGEAASPPGSPTAAASDNRAIAEGEIVATAPAEATKTDAPSHSKLFNVKELCMNIGAIYATAGITLGSIVDVIISNTLL